MHNADIQITASLPAYRMVLVFWIERNGKDNGLEKEFNFFFFRPGPGSETEQALQKYSTPWNSIP